jgi:hypothetical protein
VLSPSPGWFFIVPFFCRISKKRVQAGEKLSALPAQCTPTSVNTTVGSNGDDNDDDLPYCDDDGDDNTPPPATTPTPAAPKPTPTSTAARQQGTPVPAPAPAPAPPSGNSGSSNVETGGLYVCLRLPYSLPGTYLTVKRDLLLSKWRRRCLRHRSQRHRFDCCHWCVYTPTLSNNPIILNYAPLQTVIVMVT